ncbi:MAG: transcription antitermination factor NusB, partial [Acidobacteriota bacterium]
MSTQPRALAASFLKDLLKHRKKLDSLSQNADFLNLDSRDRRLVVELVYGVLRNLRLLDHYLGKLSRTPLKKLDESVLWVLRLALYEIEFLRIPDHAAVHEAVGLCRKIGKTSAAGFVNAVLRSFLRESPTLPEGRSARALAVRFSHPEWLVKRYLTRYGVDQTEQLLRRNNEPPIPTLWVNIFKTDLQSLCRQLEEEQISYQVYPQLPNCITVRSAGFTQNRAYQEGLCFFMDVASQEVAYLTEVKNHQMLADLCCAPGGKAFLLVSQKGKDA